MSFYPITVNTEPEAEAHIFAEDDAAIYQSVFGGDCVFDIGGKLKLTILSNNKVRIGDGVLCVGGHIGRNKYGEYEDLDIDNGVSGKNRNDLIVARFATTGTGGIDTFTLSVKKGTAGTTAVDPSIAEGNLYEGERLREFPLYRVKIEGLSIVKTEKLFSIRKTNEQLQSDIDKIKIGNGKVIIKQANTQKGSFTLNQTGDTTIELTDNNTTYSNMTAATASAAGEAGLAPAPAAGGQVKYLRGDGTWQALINSLTATAAGFALDARQGTVLNDKITTLNNNLSNSLRFKGAIPSTDLDSITTPGIYSIDGQSLKISWSSGGAAATGTQQLWGTLIVLPYYKTQILITHDFVRESSSPCLAIRFYMGNPAGWTYWRIFG